MDRTLLVRGLMLYLPVAAAVAFGRLRLRTHRHIAAVLAGFSWSLPSLLLLQIINLRFHWWTFHAEGGLIRAMPVDAYLGWSVLWGILPILAFPRLKAWATIPIFVLVDLLSMPACAPVVQLSSWWLIGEAAAVIIVLLPAQLFARWSWNAANVSGRALFWVVSFSALIFFVLPEIAFAVGGRGGWQPLFAGGSWLRNLELQLVLVPGVIALSAAQEFARRGLGTPIPFDPPQRLVVSGLYRYLSSPMQIAGALALTIWGLLLHNPWLAAAGPVTFVYSAGLAHWHENEDMRRRFDGPWLLYRRHVSAWIPRWHPWHAPEASLPRLYIAAGCGPCSEIRRWFEGRLPIALTIVDAEQHPTRDLRRIAYNPMDGTPEEEGVAAIARGLEHINLGWAVIGACLRLPVIRPLAQIVVDAAGFGPQTVRRTGCALPEGRRNASANII